MGQKVNPIGLRIPLTRDWQSRWIADKKTFGKWLQEDLKLRDFVKKRLSQAAVSKVKIERFANRIRVTVFSGRPGLVIGRKGAEIERIKSDLSAMVENQEVAIDIVEIKTPEVDAQLVAENIAQQLERRVSFRRAMKRAVQTAMENGAVGIKVRCAGRLGGAELARVEQYKDGKIPLHTLRADIDYGFAEARTLAGAIGVKVWICKSDGTEVSDHATDAQKSQAPKSPSRFARR